MLINITKISFSVILIAFSIVQFNDPDPLIWVLVYGLSSILILLSAFINIPKVIFYLFVTFIFFWCCSLTPSLINWIIIEKGSNLMQVMQTSKPYIEETRECLGLFITFIMLLIVFRIDVIHDK